MGHRLACIVHKFGHLSIRLSWMENKFVINSGYGSGTLRLRRIIPLGFFSETAAARDRSPPVHGDPQRFDRDLQGVRSLGVAESWWDYLPLTSIPMCPLFRCALPLTTPID